MKRWLIAGAAIMLAAGALAPVARAQGPRPSSENRWPGISNADIGAGEPAAASPYGFGAAPQYVWQEGYDRGGKWRGRWVPIR